ncbi:hypothetical protein [Bacillus thuringiensis]|uniref:hypothetical protein n=1 Tax=Bacillus thuringiensis TaxID=1428 RepID=UPI0021B3D429|nr:hypothetical protein [Bacillus thuringiensis]
MAIKKNCQCSNCKKKNENNSKLYLHLKRGDSICVSSLGMPLHKKGIFLLIKDSLLMWFDEKHQLNQTSLKGIHIEKLP